MGIIIGRSKAVFLVAMVALLLFALSSYAREGREAQTTATAAIITTTKAPTTQVETTISEKELLAPYPAEIQELYFRNKESSDFVFSYFEEKDKEHVIDLSEYKDSGTMPLFIQWDKRWGYLDYGGECAAVSACGPMCISMIGYHFTKNEEVFAPDKVIAFALDEGYKVAGVGTSWSFMTEGAKKLGLEAEVLSFSEQNMINSLKEGKYLVMSMSPGHFTDTGHFIVVRGYEDGKFVVNDPDSYIRSERTWAFNEFSDQVKNIWVIGYNG